MAGWLCAVLQIHDLYVTWGSTVSDDGTSPHGFRITSMRGGHLTSSLVYAMEGGLVVEVEQYGPHGVTQTAMHRMLRRLLARGAAGATG